MVVVVECCCRRVAVVVVVVKGLFGGDQEQPIAQALSQHNDLFGDHYSQLSAELKTKDSRRLTIRRQVAQETDPDMRFLEGVSLR